MKNNIADNKVKSAPTLMKNHEPNLLESSSYELAYQDRAFLGRDEMAAMRMHLEIDKAKLIMRELEIKSTIVVIGSARITERAPTAMPDLSHYYWQAYEFAKLCAAQSKKMIGEFIIATGGGPGIMEAANRGAFDQGVKSCGFNVILPNEQNPNPYIAPQLCFNYESLAIRKMQIFALAKAIAVFPGGFGTIDELFEALTLRQTGIKPKIPILMFGQEFWQKTLNLSYLTQQGLINREDQDLLRFVDSAEQAWNIIADHYNI